MIFKSSVAEHDPDLEGKYSTEITGWIISEYSLLQERSININATADEYVKYRVLLVATNKALAKVKTTDEKAGASGASVGEKEQAEMWKEKRKSYQERIVELNGQLSSTVSHVQKRKYKQFTAI